MKRSEMVNKIAKYLIFECGDKDDDQHISNSFIDANEILKIVEDSGMLPPEWEYVKNRKLWEPEND